MTKTDPHRKTAINWCRARQLEYKSHTVKDGKLIIMARNAQNGVVRGMLPLEAPKAKVAEPQPAEPDVSTETVSTRWRK